MSVYFERKSTNVNYSTMETWTSTSSIESHIQNKVMNQGKTLKTWNMTINRGILTEYNEAFIINSDIYEQLISTDPKSEEIIRPILRGRDIRRYGYFVNNLWLITTHNGITHLEIPPINIEDYPAVKKHLDNYYDKLSKRGDKGVTPYNLRSCEYMDDFNKPKIMYPNMTKYLPFYLDTSGFVQNDKSFMITGNHLEYLCAFFNSSLFKYCYINNFPELLGGTRELRKIFFDKISVMDVPDEINEKFSELVLKIQLLRKKGMDSKELEEKVDELIFELYGLTEDEKSEIGFIEIT